MPRRPRLKPLPFMINAEIENAERDFAPLLPKLLASVAASLKDAGGHANTDTEAQICEAVDDFKFGRSSAPFYGQPGSQKALLKRLGAGGRVLPILDQLAPEFLVQLSSYLLPADAVWMLDPVGEPPDVISRVRRAARRFYMEYKPADGRTTDLVLETVVRALARIVEQVLGHPPLVSMNKNNGMSGPTPRCAGAEAIERLVVGVDPTTTRTAVMNMIVKVAGQPEPTPDPLYGLISSSLIGALGASLLPGRAEAIAKLRDDPFCFDDEPEPRQRY